MFFFFCNRSHPGSVAGAYLSGIRAANEVLSRYHQSNGTLDPMDPVAMHSGQGIVMHPTPPPPPFANVGPGSPFLASGFSPQQHQQASPYNDLPLMSDLLGSAAYSFRSDLDHQDMLEENI